MTGLLDTSVVLGPPSADLPDEGAISVITVAEIRLGVLVAASAEERAARLDRLVQLERTYDALPVDDAVAAAYAKLVASERERGRRPRAMDALIAATALARGVALYTRDENLAKMSGLTVKLVR